MNEESIALIYVFDYLLYYTLSYFELYIFNNNLFSLFKKNYYIYRLRILNKN